MKKKNIIIVSSIIVGLVIVGAFKLSSAKDVGSILESNKTVAEHPTEVSTTSNSENPEQIIDSEVFIPTVHQSVVQMQDLNMLITKATIIVEGVGEDVSTTKFDYKGKPMFMTTLKVVNVIKGDEDLKEVKVMQLEGAEKPFKKGEQLLLFLRNNVEVQTDSYNIVGTTTQGVYELKNNAFKAKSIFSEEQGSKIVQLHDMDNGNKNLAKELEGDYEDIKNKLK